MNIERMMSEQGEGHWSERAVCRGDKRFTGKWEWLSAADKVALRGICANCPVFADCDDWASSPHVRDVFAAGYWRFPGEFIDED